MTKPLTPHALLVMYALEHYRDADTNDLMALTGLGHIQLFDALVKTDIYGFVQCCWARGLERPMLLRNLTDKGRRHLDELRGVVTPQADR